MIFIDFEAKVWPCTWLGAPSRFVQDNSLQRTQLMRAISKYSEDFNSVRAYALEEILEHPWFDKDLVNSWSKEKLATCSRTCGDKIEYTNGFNINSKLELINNDTRNILPSTMDSHRHS